MTTLQATTTNVIYKKRPRDLRAGNIHLIQDLSKEVQWCDAVVSGPDSVIESGDEILLSARPVSYEFRNPDTNELSYNTADASIMMYKRNGTLNATCGTIIYEMITKPEEVTDSGIVVVTKTANKELEPIWCLAVAAGPTSGILPGDKILIAYKSDCYVFKIDGKELRNAGKEEVIAFTSFSA